MVHPCDRAYFSAAGLGEGNRRDRLTAPDLWIDDTALPPEIKRKMLEYLYSRWLHPIPPRPTSRIPESRVLNSSPDLAAVLISLA